MNNCRENHRKKGENVAEFCTLKCFLKSKVRDFFLYRIPENVTPTLWAQSDKEIKVWEEKKKEKSIPQIPWHLNG